MADPTKDVMLTRIEMLVTGRNGNTEVEMSLSPKIPVTMTGTGSEKINIGHKMKYVVFWM